ncbi:hypothetical protein [Niastella sp. OAS944]|uniref:hypothetical protein n=1 Tax=Niastella sp. OAS944 TaxID=2664089 RepID=UPI003484D5F0|nr:hypothetical protein [Chitinophagaceae bacterium OAS944]
MDLSASTIVLMIPAEDLNLIKTQQQIIIDRLNVLTTQPVQYKTDIPENYVTAIEFMDAVRIRRSKFDELVGASKIKTIKKKRKIYVPVSEIERYFKDPSIQ